MAKQIAFASMNFFSLNFKISTKCFFVFRFAFDTFDANNDGSIDFDEFLLAVSATSQGDVDERLAVAFDM